MDIIEKYTQIYWSPFLAWVFMWVNAMKDVALFVDGPDCVFYKADILYKTHDLNSLIKDASINTKLYFSWVMPNKMIRWYDNQIKRKLWFIAENDKFNLWIVTCMPVTWLLATQYNNLFDDFNKDFLFVPSFTDKFRIDWYWTLLKSLADFIKFEKKKKKLHIWIVWFLFDRNEWDCIWNLNEIKRILSLLWIKISSIWFDWNNYSELKKIENSELIISFKYWLRASKAISKKLDVEVLELEVPFGLSNIIKFITEISNKLWLDKGKIDDIISKEIKIIKQKIDLLDSKMFINKNYIYAWDPFLENSIIDIWEFLWMNHVKTYKYIWSKRAKKSDIKEENIDLLIWNSDFENPWFDYIQLEFWFPSYTNHFLQDRPYMWFTWFLFFIEKIYNIFVKKDLQDE